MCAVWQRKLYELSQVLCEVGTYVFGIGDYRVFHVVDGRILGRRNVALAGLDCELQAVTSDCSAL
jgi:hypothetical protein